MHVKFFLGSDFRDLRVVERQTCIWERFNTMSRAMGCVGRSGRAQSTIGIYLIVTDALSAGTVPSEMNVSLWMVGGRKIDPVS